MPNQFRIDCEVVARLNSVSAPASACDRQLPLAALQSVTSRTGPHPGGERKPPSTLTMQYSDRALISYFKIIAVTGEQFSSKQKV